MIFKNNSAEKIHRFFIKKGLSFACAESCTGGLLSKRLTDREGSSVYFMGAVVSYHNSVKEKLLGVRKKTLSEYGAVSAECAVEMAEGVRALLGSDISVSVTGIAGPTGGSEDKPVGTLYAAFCVGEDVVVRHFLFKGSRKSVREKAVDQVMRILLQLMQTEYL